MCQWRFAKHFTGFLPLPMRDMCTFDTALSLPVGESNNGVLFTCKRKKRQNFSENKKEDEAERMFFLLHDFIAVVGEGRLWKSREEGKAGRLQKQKKLGHCECLGAFTSQLPVVEKARKASPGRQESESYMARLPFLDFFFCVLHDTHFRFQPKQKQSPCGPAHKTVWWI